jgi:hypothetical protein
MSIVTMQEEIEQRMKREAKLSEIKKTRKVSKRKVTIN